MSRTDAPHRRPLAGATIGILSVLFLAAFLRFYSAGTWSLWEDEETAIHFSQRPDKPFPSSFPVFFYLLRWWFDLTGIDVAAGRWLTASLGVASIAALYYVFRQPIGSHVALWASLLAALSLGHVFWSQSIRYYILVFLFQLVSIQLFLVGFERGRLWALPVSNALAWCAIATHFSAVLLLPVFVAHLVICIWRRQTEGGYHWRGYLAFGIPFLMVAAAFVHQMLGFRSSMGGLITAEAQTGTVGLLARCIAYFGAPTVGLAGVGLIVGRAVATSRILQFLALLALLPILELVVIRELNLAIVTWYYAFIALAGFATLAGIGIVGISRLSLAIGKLAGVGAVLVSLVLLFAYYTSMWGDRPRWNEAAEWLRSQSPRLLETNEAGVIFATVPGVVAFYLGVDPAETMGHPRVRGLPKDPSSLPNSGEEWFVVEASVLSDSYRRWFEVQCALQATFEARTGPKDRTIRVYRRLQQGT